MFFSMAPEFFKFFYPNQTSEAIIFSYISIHHPYTCSTSSLLFLQSLYVAIAVRVLQGLHHSKAVPVGSRMSGGHAIQRCCIHLFALSLVATHAEEGRVGS